MVRSKNEVICHRIRPFLNALTSRYFFIAVIAPIFWVVIALQIGHALELIAPDYRQIVFWLSVAYGISVLLALRHDDPENP
ncbi:hypothetical protein [Sphingobium sp. Cam5-1]|uniref:hypothetical protein n=1 Tax=Sphingobium sp. Cam5-1 TaxID=2789327 RepID=UPI0018AD2E49|nr:hypothetical protein [Sphingobium sp. Cam5-1]QPI73088.1 hypothetical protein IZV00_00750 [Sphingobium sp. Cam5-1]